MAEDAEEINITGLESWDEWLSKWNLSELKSQLKNSGISRSDDFKYIKSKAQFQELSASLNLNFIAKCKLMRAWQSCVPTPQQPVTQIHFLGEEEAKIFNTLKERFTSLSNDIHFVKESFNEFNESVVETKQNINQQADYMISIINKKRKELLHEIEAISNKKRKVLNDKIYSLQQLNQLMKSNKDEFITIASNDDITSDERRMRLQKLLVINMDDEHQKVHIGAVCVIPHKISFVFNEKLFVQNLNSTIKVWCDNKTKEWNLKSLLSSQTMAHQRGERMVKILEIMLEIQELKDLEQTVHKYLNANEFLDAIAVHYKITEKIFGELQHVSCLGSMRKRFGVETKLITNKLSQQLVAIMSDAPYLDERKLLIIWQSYYKLNCLHLIAGILQEICSNILFTKCIHVLCKHLGDHASCVDLAVFLIRKCHSLIRQQHDSTSLNIKTYKDFCRKLKPEQFMTCFMDICGRVFDILHVYYKIELNVIQFRSENEILSQDMTGIREHLWIETQDLLGGLLECSQFSFKTKIKMEDLLLSLRGASIFKIIGHAFSGSDSVKLDASIRHKCISYLDHFRCTFFESIKTNFDNEMWLVLPIDSHFGIHSIEELQKNTHAHDITKKKEHDSYESFLSGDNVFDQLLSHHIKGAQTTTKQNQYLEEKENNVDNNASQLQLCITSTSLNLAKFIGECLQIMESLDIVAQETFMVLKNSFRFYLYHIFIWFGVNVNNFFNQQESEKEFVSALDKLRRNRSRHKSESQQHKQSLGESIAQKKYPILSQVINEVNESLRSRKLAPELEDLICKKLKNNVRRPRRLPHDAKCYMQASKALRLYSHETMQSVAARFVATETLTFLVNVIKSQHDRLIQILLKSNKVSLFITEIENVVSEFKKYMYRNVPTLLVHLGSRENKDSIISHIKNTNWNMKQLTTEPNGYVSELISIFTRIENVLGSFQTLPQFIHNRLNKEAIIYVEEQLVEAYADCKKCTTEGRALMSLDQNVLRNSYPISKYQHSWRYTTDFIQAYYLSQADLLQWIQQHPEYPLKAHKSFLKIGRASEKIKRKERQQLEKDIERIYQQTKEKQEEQQVQIEELP